MNISNVALLLAAVNVKWWNTSTVQWTSLSATACWCTIRKLQVCQK